MTYGNGTLNLAAALDTAHHENSARRRSLRMHGGHRFHSVRHTLGAALVAAGQLLLGPTDSPPARARPSRT